MRNLAAAAGIPMPRLGIAQVAIPNAFAFGRTVRDSRICVTEGIVGLLAEKEMRAVLGHEMSHIKTGCPDHNATLRNTYDTLPHSVAVSVLRRRQT